ncbi:MAG TPA: rod shape-determining protein MreD [Gammaproteobacteria bacterium]|nr:rod shape-determining protein MreD [Gammaproteobacteria bacterium]
MRNLKAITLTLFAALCLTLLPMPEWSMWARPAWVLLILIYWTMMSPSLVNVGLAWVMGLFMDVLTGSLLGEHALALTIVIYLVCRLRMRIKMYPMLQQGLSILIFVLIYQFILFCIQGFLGNAPHTHKFWLSSVTSMLLWPWLFAVLRDYCNRARFSLAD